MGSLFPSKIRLSAKAAEISHKQNTFSIVMQYISGYRTKFDLL